jgi:hypothetical protein
LIDGAVAPFPEIAFAELLGNLVEHVAAVIKTEFLVIGVTAQHACRAVVVVVDASLAGIVLFPWVAILKIMTKVIHFFKNRLDELEKLDTLDELDGLDCR